MGPALCIACLADCIVHRCCVRGGTTLHGHEGPSKPSTLFTRPRRGHLLQQARRDVCSNGRSSFDAFTANPGRWTCFQRTSCTTTTPLAATAPCPTCSQHLPHPPRTLHTSGSSGHSQLAAFAIGATSTHQRNTSRNGSSSVSSSNGGSNSSSSICTVQAYACTSAGPHQPAPCNRQESPRTLSAVPYACWLCCACLTRAESAHSTHKRRLLFKRPCACLRSCAWATADASEVHPHNSNTFPVLR